METIRIEARKTPHSAKEEILIDLRVVYQGRTKAREVTISAQIVKAKVK